MLDFIEGGPGDLCRLYMQDGEVVAYGVPPGGGAVPALAFLSIMAQTTAVPLAPGSQESDVLYFCEYFNAKHLRAALSFRHDTVDYVGQVLGYANMHFYDLKSVLAKNDNVRLILSSNY